MSEKYLSVSKLLVLLLLIAAPLLIHQAYLGRRENAANREALRASFSTERTRLAAEITAGFLKEDLAGFDALFQREGRTSPLQGIAPFPEPTAFFEWFPKQPKRLSPDDQTRFLEMLQQDGVFFSGMPRKYSALVLLLGAAPPADPTRLYQVAASFWSADGVDDETFRFLIDKMPPSFKARFHEQRLYLGEGPLTTDGSVYARLVKDDRTVLARLEPTSLKALNTRFDGLGLEVAAHPASAWKVFEGVTTNVELKPNPPQTNGIHPALFYSGLFLFIELTLLSILYVLNRYGRLITLQKRLLSTTSHELRTPLAVIRQFSEMMLAKPDTLSERQTRYVKHIHGSCMRMFYLIENMLEAAKFERFRPEAKPSPFALKPWLESLVRGLAQTWGDQVIKLDCPSIDVCWDADLMNQAVVNLLVNGKNHAGTDLEVRVTSAGERVHVSVRDFGAAKANLKSGDIQAFRRGNSHSAGLGLGLFIVQRAVRAHRGSLHFDQMKPGLMVTMHLPRLLEGVEHENLGN